MAQTLDDKTAKRILDMLARKAGGYEFTMFASDVVSNCFVTPSVNYHYVYNPAEADTRFLMKNNIFIRIDRRLCTYDVILEKLLEHAAKNDINVNTMSSPVFIRKNTTLEELLVQLDLEV